MLERSITSVVEVVLKQHPSLFLIDFQAHQANQFTVVIDGDQPVSVKDCMEINREIEAEFDRETEDFSLKVTSAGVSAPLKFPRQYRKNIGRKLKVETADEKYKAKLIDADDNSIKLRWKQREPKPVGKGKHTVSKQVELTYEEIKKAKVMITFN